MHTNSSNMKVTSLILILFFGINLIAQNTEGIVTYEDKRNIHKTMPPEMEAMKDRIPEFRSSESILYFNAEEAVYKNVKKEKKKNEEFRGEGRRRRWGRQNANNIYYTDLKEKTSVDSREFFGKKFLIEGARGARKWKITGDQKMVGDYICQKAEFKDSTENIVVWFTPMVPVSTGPGNFYGLPGLILHVDINDGERLITAQGIELQELEEGIIARPTEGEKISDTDFAELRDKKMEEMRQERGGKGGFGRRFGRGR